MQGTAATGRIALVLLVCVCPAAGANYAELASLEFTPHPISSELPIARPGDASRADETPAARGGGRDIQDYAEWADAIERRVRSVAETQSADGPRAEDLVGELTALAAQYGEIGEYDAAISALERAWQIRRVHDGLYTLDQVEIIEQLIDMRLARDEFQESAALEQQVLELTGRHPSDPRVAHVLSTAGDRQMDIYHRTRREGAVGVEVVLSANPGSMGGWQAERRGYTALSAVRAARRNYSRAIGAAWRTGSHDGPGLLELREKLVDTYYWQLHDEGTDPDMRPHDENLVQTAVVGRRGPPSPGRLYTSGAAALEALARDRSILRAPPAAVAAAWIELGDWYLLFSRNGKALDMYERVYDFLTNEAGTDEATVAGLFSVEPPRALPLLEPETRGAAAPYRGYVDVAFEITKYGQGKDLEVLARSPGTSDDVESRLKRYVYSSRFRPKLVDGRAVDTERVSVRYYFDY